MFLMLMLHFPKRDTKDIKFVCCKLIFLLKIVLSELFIPLLLSNMSLIYYLCRNQ